MRCQLFSENSMKTLTEEDNHICDLGQHRPFSHTRMTQGEDLQNTKNGVHQINNIIFVYQKQTKKWLEKFDFLTTLAVMHFRKRNFQSPDGRYRIQRGRTENQPRKIELMFEGTSALKVPSVITLDPQRSDANINIYHT